MKPPVREHGWPVPEEVLWTLLHASMGSCLQLLELWLRTGEQEVYRRAMDLLGRIHACTGFLPAKRLGMFCGQWRELLLKAHAGTQEAALILQAGVRIEHRLAWACGRHGDRLLDLHTLNRLRAACAGQGGSSVSRPPQTPVVSPCFVLALGNAVQRILCSPVSEPNDLSVQGLPVLQVASFWPQLSPTRQGGGAAEVPAVALLSLHQRISACRLGVDAGAHAAGFLCLARRALMEVLLSRWRELVDAVPGQGQMNRDELAGVLACSRVCLRHFAARDTSRSCDRLCELAQNLLNYLQCIFARDLVGERMLMVCLLALERQVLKRGLNPDPAVAEGPAVALLERRIRRFLRARRHRLRESMLGWGAHQRQVQARGLDELQVLLPDLCRVLVQQGRRVPAPFLPDELLYLCSRMCVCVLCLGWGVLYEMLCGVRSLLVLAVEQRLQLTGAYLHCLARLLTRIHRMLQKQDVLEHLLPALRALQMASARVLAGQRHPQSLHQPAHEGGVPVRVDALPVYLTEHLHTLLLAPELLQQAVHTGGTRLDSRACLLELTLLGQGARALAVWRVADLAEGLMEVHRALQIDRASPAPETLALLGEIHQALRACLNHAAARQCVPDVRGPLARLYAWLEAASPLPVSRQSSDVVRLTRALTAGMQALEDALALGNHPQGLPLLRRLLSEQQERCLQLEEELEDAGRVRLGRWRSRLWRVVARCASATDTEVRLSLENDALQLDRRLADALLPVVEQMLEWLIGCSGAQIGQPGVTGNALVKIHLRPRLNQQTLVLALLLESQALPELVVPDGLQSALHWLDASLRLRPGGSGKQVLLLSLPARAPRWDIAAKPL
ncbi:MAG: hypothetical protein R3F26_01185 [Gammaproteobacteria bacterium]|nr:hypothetical protein [Pseudomonadales bacterium]